MDRGFHLFLCKLGGIRRRRQLAGSGRLNSRAVAGGRRSPAYGRTYWPLSLSGAGEDGERHRQR